MKPIIIGVANGKVDMSLDEFKKFMNDAYYQGYNDGCSTGSVAYCNKPHWWNNLTDCTNTSADTAVTLNGGLTTSAIEED